MKNIIILYTEAGGGHKSAACALKAIISQETNWRVTLVNPFKEISHNFDLLKKITNMPCEDIYNKYVSKKERSLLNLIVIAGFFKFNIFLYYKKIVNVFANYWQKQQPDMVISVMPFVNNIINDSLKQHSTAIPFVTLITDYSECVKDIWFSSHDQLLICNSQKLVKQAEAKGHPKHKVFLSSGLIVSPEFYNLSIISTDKNAARLKLGLQPDLPVGLVMFGGYGSNVMLKIAKNMNRSKGVQLIFICGHNLELQHELEQLQVNYPKLVLGFVKDAQNYMALADFFISKPGGLSISEASIMQLPIIVQDNIFTLLQEKYNAQWLKENNIGICVKNFAKISEVTTDLLNSRDRFKNSYSHLNNRAIFEIPGILQQIFDSK